MRDTGNMAKRRCENPTGGVASRFLRDDIQGDRILLPFLTTGSRLRLSECCRDMRLYRDYLASVRVVEADTNPEARRRFAQWVTHWKPGYLQHLQVFPSSSFVLDLTQFGCFQGLKTLECDLTCGWQSSLPILQALVSKGLTSLEELHVNVQEYQDEDMEMHYVIFRTFDEACPNLQRLYILFPEEESFPADDNLQRGDMCCNLAGAIESGHWRHLRELTVSGYSVEYESGFVLAALAKGKCPSLVEVDFDLFIHDTEFEMEAHIGDTFLSGAFDSVEGLRVVSVGQHIILEGIDARQYPNMKRLTLWDSSLNNDSLASLGRALAQGSFPNLETLAIPPFTGYSDGASGLPDA